MVISTASRAATIEVPRMKPDTAANASLAVRASASPCRIGAQRRSMPGMRSASRIRKNVSASVSTPPARSCTASETPLTTPEARLEASLRPLESMPDAVSDAIGPIGPNRCRSLAAAVCRAAPIWAALSASAVTSPQPTAPTRITRARQVSPAATPRGMPRRASRAANGRSSAAPSTASATGAVTAANSAAIVSAAAATAAASSTAAHQTTVASARVDPG